MSIAGIDVAVASGSSREPPPQRQERVRRVIEPILAGGEEQAWTEEDLLYLRDLGLIAREDGGTPRIANPISTRRWRRAICTPPCRQACRTSGPGTWARTARWT